MSQTKPPNKFAVCLGISVSTMLGYLWSAIFLMFASALVNKNVHQVPALGYWASFGLVWVLAIFGGAWDTSKNTNEVWRSFNK